MRFSDIQSQVFPPSALLIMSMKEDYGKYRRKSYAPPCTPHPPTPCALGAVGRIDGEHPATIITEDWLQTTGFLSKSQA